jgi:hypothetical protein
MWQESSQVALPDAGRAESATIAENPYEHWRLLVPGVGVELSGHIDNTQVIENTKRQKSTKRSNRPSSVHHRYTENGMTQKTRIHVRLDSAQIADLKAIARHKKTSVSALGREAVTLVIRKFRNHIS